MPTRSLIRCFLAPLMVNIVDSMHVASVPRPQELKKAREELVGYPIVIENRTRDAHFGYLPVASAFNEHELTANVASRLVRYEVVETGGIGDRLEVIATLLSIATQLKAMLAFPSPQQALEYGNTSAVWWDEYVITQPKFAPLNQVDCLPEVTTFTITNKTSFEEMLSSDHPVLSNPNQPLCIRIQQHYFKLKNSPLFERLAETGGAGVSMWTSNKVALLAKQVKTELTSASGNYNALHVRLGDGAGPACEDAEHLAETVLNMTQGSPPYAQQPWFLMSDGSEQFFADMHHAMSRRGIALIAETDLATTEAITDDYLIASALECVFGASDVALITDQDIGHWCMPEETDAVNRRPINCSDAPYPVSGL